jgi:hypothetical protein
VPTFGTPGVRVRPPRKRTSRGTRRHTMYIGVSLVGLLLLILLLVWLF